MSKKFNMLALAGGILMATSFQATSVSAFSFAKPAEAQIIFAPGTSVKKQKRTLRSRIDQLKAERDTLIQQVPPFTDGIGQDREKVIRQINKAYRKPIQDLRQRIRSLPVLVPVCVLDAEGNGFCH